MAELLGRFRFPLLYLLLTLVCVLALSSRRGPNELGLGTQLIMEVTVPLEEMVTLPVRELRAVWDSYVALVEVRLRNETLSGEVARLREENLQFREAILASERYERFRAFHAAREVPMVPANVVAQDLSPWFQSVILDQGANAGLRPGMPVVTDAGLVGIVSGTTPRAAKVLLVTDPQSRVDAYVQRSRARGTMRGDARGRMSLDYLPREDAVEEGDLVVSSGQGGLYPRGLIVGRVEEVKRQPYGLFQSVRVAPAVDLSKLEEVFVLLERRELPEAEAFVTEDASLFDESGG